MKRIWAIGWVLLLLSAFSGCAPEKGERMEGASQVSIMGTADFISFDYPALKQEAAAILRIEALDDLTSGNSYVQYHKDQPEQSISSFYASRRVKVLEVYKGELAAGEEINITETAAIVEDADSTVRSLTPGQVVPLEEGKEYVVFLAYGETIAGEWVLHLIAGSNGTIELTNFSSNLRPDIAVRTAVDYFSDLPSQLKAELLCNENVHLEQGPLVQLTRIQITALGPMTLKCGKAGNRTYIQVEIDGQRILVEASKEARTQLNALVSE